MSSSNATCYYNDGSVVNNNYFCGLPNQDTCCGPGWVCLSNGLCRQSSGTEEYAQGSCTDPSFKKCLSFCNYTQAGNFAIVQRCEPAGNSWCFECASQDPTGIGCCDTNLITSLEPYPFTIGILIQSPVDRSSSTTSIASVTELTSSNHVTSLEPTSETFIKTSTQNSATPTGALTSSPSTPSTNQSRNSKTDINVGITVAIVVILLAILAFFIIQNRKFRRLLQLREGLSGQEKTRTAVQRGNEDPPGELDHTHYELAQPNMPRHELFGNEIHEVSGNEVHELYHSGVPEHDLARDRS